MSDELFEMDAPRRYPGRTGLRPAAFGHREAGRSRIPVDGLALLARRPERRIADFFA